MNKRQQRIRSAVWAAAITIPICIFYLHPMSTGLVRGWVGSFLAPFLVLPFSPLLLVERLFYVGGLFGRPYWLSYLLAVAAQFPFTFVIVHVIRLARADSATSQRQERLDVSYDGSAVCIIASSKLESYEQHMAANGVDAGYAFPTTWRMLWSIGIKLPPPPFLGFVSIVLIAGSLTGPGPLLVLSVFVLWLLNMPGVTAVTALTVGVTTNVGHGLIMAAYCRHMARKHRLGSWAAYQAPKLST